MGDVKLPIGGDTGRGSTGSQNSNAFAGKDTNDTNKQKQLDQEQEAREARCPFIAKIVHAQWFESFIACVIISNCATMGLEADASVGKVPEYWMDIIGICEHVFTFLFLVELLMRILIFGWKAFIPGIGGEGSLFNFIDAQLVLITGVLITWILPIFGISGETVRILTVLRALRLVRLVRVIRKVELFREVYLLLRGLTDSVRTLFWTVIVIFFITYVFAVFGVVLISSTLKDRYGCDSKPLVCGPDLEKGSTEEGLLEATNGITPFMYTLIQVLTGDSWTSLARASQDELEWSWVFWFLYMAVAAIVLMNLVTAIIVDNAIQNSMNDEQDMLHRKEKEREKQFDEFKLLFEIMDDNNNGEVSMREFEEAFDEPKVAAKLANLDFQPDHLRELFQLLDTGDGNLSFKEFFEGLTRMQGTASAKDVFKVMKFMEAIIHMLDQLHNETVDDVNQIMENTPGAKRNKRPADLKVRSMKAKNDRNAANGGDDASTGRTTVISHGGNSTGRSSVATGPTLQNIGESLSAINQRLDSFETKFQQCRESTSACNKKIDDLSTEISAIKADAETQRKTVAMSTQQITVLANGKTREIPCCTAFSRPDVQQTIVPAIAVLPQRK